MCFSIDFLPIFSASEVQGEKEKLREELEHERRRKHEAEAVAAAAVGYGLYERHEKHEVEGDLERYEPQKEKKHHGLFGGHWLMSLVIIG